MLGLGLELLAVLVQVQLLAAEAQSLAAGAEGDELESQDALVEVAGAGEVANREYHVIQAVDEHGVRPRLIIRHRRRRRARRWHRRQGQTDIM